MKIGDIVEFNQSIYRDVYDKNKSYVDSTILNKGRRGEIVELGHIDVQIYGKYTKVKIGFDHYVYVGYSEFTIITNRVRDEKINSILNENR